MLIFIIGYMGAGKTTLGKMIADRLHHRFLDLDEMIEISTGYNVNTMFEKFGEQAFRQRERDILFSHLDDIDTVIATGGGTPCFWNNMERMNQSGITIFIDTPYETIKERLAGKFQNRPLFRDIPQENLSEFILKHMAARRVFYEASAIVVKSENIDMEDLSRRIQAFGSPTSPNS